MAKLTRDEILDGLLRTIVEGWGIDAVRKALTALASGEAEDRHNSRKDGIRESAPSARELASGLELSSEIRLLVIDLAERYDEGRAFPKLGDIRSFLQSHHQNAADLKTRTHGFKRMLPILTRMSPKGLERLLARSHHSGPASLGEISDAIRSAGEHWRGRQKTNTENERSSTDRNTIVHPQNPRPGNDSPAPSEQDTAQNIAPGRTDQN